MVILIIYVFVSRNEDTTYTVGTIIFLAGIFMGFSSLSDMSKISSKGIASLNNTKVVKTQLAILFSGLIFLMLISISFHSIRFIFAQLDKVFRDGFTKLGYDCLVMMLGFLCLIKQFVDQVEYVNKNKINR